MTIVPTSHKPFIITKCGKLTGRRFHTFGDAQTFLHNLYPIHERTVSSEKVYKEYCKDQPNIAAALTDGTWTHDFTVSC